MPCARRLPPGASAAMSWRLNPDTEILPVNGSREALFAFAQTVIDPEPGSCPLVVSPNPFYQIYEGAAFLAGAEPLFLNTLPENDFAMDFGALSAEESGARPAGLCLFAGQPDRQGAVAGRLENPVRPVRPLRLHHRLRRVLFGNLSRRSRTRRSADCRPPACSGARLRPAGDVLQPVQALQRAGHALRLRRRRCGHHQEIPALPHLPRLRHDTAGAGRQRSPPGTTKRMCWTTAACTARNSLPCTPLIAEVLGTGMPDAGFYLWAKDTRPNRDTEFARGLLGHYNVIVLPGSFLAREADGVNPGRRFRPHRAGRLAGRMPGCSARIRRICPKTLIGDPFHDPSPASHHRRSL